MCVVSAVMDYGRQVIPNVPQQPWMWPMPNVVPPVVPEIDNEALRRLLASFRTLVEAAEEFDRANNQPDCVDPEKAQLLERVAELEHRLDLVEGGHVDEAGGSRG